MTINPNFRHILVLIKGAGDLASGVACRLKRSGFPLMMTELPAPLLVRRAVAFGDAVYTGETTVEDITARCVDTLSEARQLAYTEKIPIIIDPQTTLLAAAPQVLIDAIMAKTNTGTNLTDAPLVIALGPGFTAGQDCHVVIETNRGHNLGRVITQGQAEANTGTPAVMKGYAANRVLRSPANGNVMSCTAIGDGIKQGQLIATVAGQEICAPFDGVLRGLVHSEVNVTIGMKIGDLDPRGVVEHCFTISDKSLAIGGGVLEAILSSPVSRRRDVSARKT